MSLLLTRTTAITGWRSKKEKGGSRCNGSGGSQCACMVLIGECSLVGSRAAIFLY